MGQVHAKTELGAWISFISSLKDVQKIVDVGTWSGAGSTLCVARGIKRRPLEARRGATVVGFEIDEAMVARAKSRLKSFPFVEVVHGSLVNAEDLDIDSLNSEEEGWLRSDIAKMSLAPLVLDRVPEQIDLLILDGGEFSSQAEYLALRDRISGWVVLDDTGTRKNKKVFGLLAMDNSFALIWATKERNGAAIFRKLYVV
jgi:hypothetical protein